MKVPQNCVLGLVLLFFQFCLAQRGYNYVRPAIRGSSPTASGGNNAASLPTNSISSPLRPIVAALPTGNAATGTGFPTSPTAFGAPSNPKLVPSTTAFGVFQGNLAAGLAPTASSTAIGSNFGVGTGPGLPNRSAATQRSGSSIFGSNSDRRQPTQFTSGAASAAGTDVDYEGDGDFSAIPGVPGVDYPIYSQVPQTNFDCSQQALPGYYSDVDTQCQVFHICALNRTYSFLCPNGTVFSQETLVCVWWNQYDCDTAPTLYANNAFIYDYRTEGGSENSANYQGTSSQLGIGSTARSQNAYQITANTGRNTVTQPTGIFGGTVGTRPTVTNSGFGTGPSPLTPAPATVFGGSSFTGQGAVGRLQQAGILPTAQGQAFSDTSTTIGSVVRGGADNTAIIPGGIGGQQSALQVAQLSSSSTNREYLPPSRRP